MYQIDVNRILSKRNGKYPFIVAPAIYSDIYLETEMELGSQIRDKRALLLSLKQKKYDALDILIEECTPDEIQQEYRAGLSELSFANYLRANNYHVRSFAKMRYHTPDTSNEYEPEFEPRPANRNYFYPDLLFIDHNSSIVIDIEIDEPYSIKNNTPIHYVCTNEDEEGYTYTRKEEYRNRYLAGKGIIVVRFAEEQVVKYPQTCLHFIESIVYESCAFKGTDTIDFDHCLEEWEEEMYISRWTEYEAVVMANNGYRKTYLPVESHKAIPANTKDYAGQSANEERAWTPQENLIGLADLARMIESKASHDQIELPLNRT